ncbi:uncharacterized protein BX664DRAFT_343697 [Halteromyces radiatus]|uniref:uncharacterized protein n=1 Tax=Halteromyces radiatus TaxID=101107 RepID=UPI00221E7AEC|nr:uncharacterized protein BX664DRAFT_343697 [Halteromyces radiatus]KAI8077864.1 hypothetical protein BX664DRAFT_343697 [Halteromyces radiatus]
MNQHPSLLDSYESSENALMDSFKAAALKVTTLYKDSLVQNRKAYASGYQQALQDLYEFISSHPSTTVSQQDSFVTPTEHGFLPVQDLLAYARQRNNQLASDMGLSSSMDSSSVPTTSSPSPPSQQQQQSNPSTDSLTNHSNHSGGFNTTTSATTPTVTNDVATTTNIATSAATTPTLQHRTTTTTVPNVLGAAVKNAFHPFQIDPNTQFTFSLPTNYHPYGQPWYNNNNFINNTNHHYSNNNNSGFNNNSDHFRNDTANINNNDSNSGVTGFNTDGTPMDGLKRRMTSNELSFMGRSLNNMNIDSNWNEPAFKRRPKRDD